MYTKVDIQGSILHTETIFCPSRKSSIYRLIPLNKILSLQQEIEEIREDRCEFTIHLNVVGMDKEIVLHYVKEGDFEFILEKWKSKIGEIKCQILH